MSRTKSPSLALRILLVPLIALALMFSYAFVWVPYEIHLAKVWCEEGADRMLANREHVEDDPGAAMDLMNGQSMPRAFHGPNSFGWGFYDDGMTVSFGCELGSYEYDTRTDDWERLGRGGPTQIVEAQLLD